MSRVLVCGGRDYADVVKVDEVLTQAFIGDGMTMLCAGGARGADELARQWAVTHGLAHAIFPAQWNNYGKSAGPIRNQQMLDEFKPDLVVAFPGGNGTAHMVSIARKAGVPVVEVPA